MYCTISFCVVTVALGALKRKKRYEKQLQQIDGTLSTIEMQREALESANTNTNVLQTMGDAAKALKRAHQDMDVDKVHDMMDDIADQQDVAREISDAISNPVAFGQDVDEVIQNICFIECDNAYLKSVIPFLNQIKIFSCN